MSAMLDAVCLPPFLSFHLGRPCVFGMEYQGVSGVTESLRTCLFFLLVIRHFGNEV